MKDDIMLKPGDNAPDFFLSDANGRKIKLSDYLGQKIALYFYPKDDTSGCTKQACSLRDGIGKLTRDNIIVLGISADDEMSHKRFADKYKLPFILLVDKDKQVCDKFIGNSMLGIKRTTFLIDEKGKIVKVIEKPNVEDHANEVLNCFKQP